MINFTAAPTLISVKHIFSHGIQEIELDKSLYKQLVFAWSPSCTANFFVGSMHSFHKPLCKYGITCVSVW